MMDMLMQIKMWGAGWDEGRRAVIPESIKGADPIKLDKVKVPMKHVWQAYGSARTKPRVI